ncbi:MAG: GNAT family N-acetyltransferase [Chloroflexi bacterium]|nr:GNAT family N-acetyltransferase [Chloroflexota bacterium]
MLTLLRANSENPDFIHLVRFLDADLARNNGDQDSFYAQFNKLNKIKHVVVAYEDGQAVACGAIKEYEPGVMEVKRMYTAPESRGKGIAGKILSELENWAAELNYHKCILETGKTQVAAIHLYGKCGYKTIPNYGQYTGVENSVCFEKEI